MEKIQTKNETKILYVYLRVFYIIFLCITYALNEYEKPDMISHLTLLIYYWCGGCHAIRTDWTQPFIRFDFDSGTKCFPKSILR